MSGAAAITGARDDDAARRAYAEALAECGPDDLAAIAALRRAFVDRGVDSSPEDEGADAETSGGPEEDVDDLVVGAPRKNRRWLLNVYPRAQALLLVALIAVWIAILLS